LQLIKIPAFNQGLCRTGGPLILALWPCRMYIATCTIVVYIPQLTTPDPRSNNPSTSLHGLQCLPIGSGISPLSYKDASELGCDATRGCPRTVIIKALIPGAYLSNIMLDRGFVKV